MKPEEAAAWTAVASAASAALVWLIRIINRPLVQDIDEVKEALRRGETRMDETSEAIARLDKRVAVMCERIEHLVARRPGEQHG